MPIDDVLREAMNRYYSLLYEIPEDKAKDVVHDFERIIEILANRSGRTATSAEKFTKLVALPDVYKKLAPCSPTPKLITPAPKLITHTSSECLLEYSARAVGVQFPHMLKPEKIRRNWLLLKYLIQVGTADYAELFDRVQSKLGYGSENEFRNDLKNLASNKLISIGMKLVPPTGKEAVHLTVRIISKVNYRENPLIFEVCSYL